MSLGPFHFLFFFLLTKSQSSGFKETFHKIYELKGKDYTSSSSGWVVKEQLNTVIEKVKRFISAKLIVK